MARSLPGSVIDLFAGAGGLSLGFRAAGCHLLAAVDVNETAAQTFQHNLGRLQSDDPPLVLSGAEGDLDQISLPDLARGVTPDIVVGGPPCQGFSRVGRAKLASLAGGRKQEDPRNALYRRFLDAVKLWQPRAVLMENVPAMRSLGGRNVADEVASDLEALGYRVGHAVLNAVWYGVPQYRERLFFLGLRKDLELEPVVPVPTHRATLPSGYLRPQEAVTISFPFVIAHEMAVPTASARLAATTVGEAIGDLPAIRDHLEPPRPGKPGFRILRPHDRTPVSAYAHVMRTWRGLEAPLELDDHVVRRTPRDHETFRRMRPDDRYPEAVKIAQERLASLLAELEARGEAPVPGSPEYEELKKGVVPNYPLDSFVDRWRKLNPDTPSWTLPAHLSKDSYSHIHHDDDQARSISVREAARLQSFPDGFAFQGNMGDCFRQIGNAVPPLLSWAIAASLLRQLGLPFTPHPFST